VYFLDQSHEGDLFPWNKWNVSENCCQVTAGKLSPQFLPVYLYTHDYLQFPQVELLHSTMHRHRRIGIETFFSLMFCYKGSMQFLILMYINFAFQHDSHPQQPKSEQLEKLEVFKAMLERLITFLQVSKNNIKPSFKEKLGSNEKHIVSFLNPSRFRKPIPNLQLGQLPQPHVQPMQQSQSLVPQLQSHENQLNTQLQSMNVQGFVPTMQQNNMSSLQHGSLSSLSGVSMSQPIMMMWDERF